jgi:hypothetical protein
MPDLITIFKVFEYGIVKKTVRIRYEPDAINDELRF